MPLLDNTILEAALIGYEAERQRISNAIAEIRAQLGERDGRRRGRPASGMGSAQAGPKRRRLSAAAKKRIAAAQKARWAAYHKERGEPAQAQPVKAKRKLSAAGRQAIIEATKKRWAAFRKAQTAAAKSKPKSRKTAA